MRNNYTLITSKSSLITNIKEPSIFSVTPQLLNLTFLFTEPVTAIPCQSVCLKGWKEERKVLHLSTVSIDTAIKLFKSILAENESVLS
jgi:hypothetical protein